MTRQLTEDDRQHLSEVLTTILRSWQVSYEHQMKLLGYPAGSSLGELKRLEGGDAFPDDEDRLDRAEQLLAIHECLRTAYPRSGVMAAQWLKQPHRRMDSRPPLEVMLEDGLPGLKQVRGLLDCTQNWVSPHGRAGFERGGSVPPSGRRAVSQRLPHRPPVKTTGEDSSS